MKRLVLAGGGHAQLAVLRALTRARPRGLETVLLTPSPWQYYSGMLPGWMAGHYREDDCRIDLRPLAAAAGVRLLLGTVCTLDADQRRLRIASDGDGGDTRSALLDYDLLSLDIGSETNTTALDALGTQRLLPVKPLPGFFAAWPRVLEAARATDGFRLCIVGGGAAGVELALAAAQALRRASATAQVALVCAPASLLIGHADRVRQRVLCQLDAAGVSVHLQRAHAESGTLRLVGSTPAEHATHDAPPRPAERLLPADCVLAATGARPQAWLRHSGLACTADGWVQVDTHHRSPSHPEVFAAGDVCARTDRALARSGVHAVHAGPVLAANLLATLDGSPPRAYVPKPHSLQLIACGPRHAIASWGRWSAEGGWVWRWKDWIDRSFIRRHRRLAPSGA
ncbi:FAD-dependent oxidoreductase [Thauera sp.]|jgi:pyridine nucleotide-disulfide oxidoreductase family protein|uniref:FAD-dependent oxidoreductase n=1 Tax=Thauera sp. TaxID=1905334 RepID=UPI00261AC5F3|nr:FAD-dependent oxidoreductase [Thauera sp.]MCK6409851.1 FAD-dependent oxidoreductase [Thauera sp.]